MTLPVAAGRPPLSIDISCSYSQQQTRRTPLLLPNDGRTDGHSTVS